MHSDSVRRLSLCTASKSDAIQDQGVYILAEKAVSHIT